VARRIVDLTLDNLDDLPPRCRSCVFWELDPVAANANDDHEIDKEAWISDTLLEWGPCGKLAYLDGTACGFVLYAPPAYVPRAASFPTAPVSSDAVLLMTARVVPGFAGKGIGNALIQAVGRDVARRGIRALEAFGHTGLAHPDGPGCVLPAGYLRAAGFKTVRQHAHTPRLRLDCKAPTAWRSEVEAVVERLLAGAPQVRVH
jgi:GNAT superfamily N-acetyltransferase